MLASIDGRGLEGMRVVIDCANGAATTVAPKVLRALGATVEVLHDEPDGTNINAGCGSTYPEDLQKAVVQRGADAGIAFDGDADRVLAVDAGGRLIDGDQIIAVTAIDRRDHGRLAKDTVVVTVMTNLGFRLGMQEHGIEVLEVPVGDRYVLEALADEGLTLGGEQSGHVVFTDLATTGDGLLTAVQLLDVVRRSGRSLAELADARHDPAAAGAAQRARRRQGHGRERRPGRRHRGRGGRARRPRPGAHPGQRHRAARARDGRGTHRRGGRSGRRTAWSTGRGGPRGRTDPPGSLSRGVRHHRSPAGAGRPARPSPR